MEKNKIVEEMLKLGFKKIKRKWVEINNKIRFSNEHELRINNFIFYIDEDLEFMEVYINDGYDGSEELEYIESIENYIEELVGE